MHPVLAGFLMAWRERTPYAKDGDYVFPSFRLKGKRDHTFRIADNPNGLIGLCRTAKTTTRGSPRYSVACGAPRVSARVPFILCDATVAFILAPEE